jgi:two-component system, chemotaxis family, protein-glutamate methylesterase/glutaminase
MATPAFPVVALVASAGGTTAVGEVLSGLPPDLPAAVLVLVHTSPDHESVLAQVLDGRTSLPVRTAADGDPLTSGVVLVAPSGFHTLVTPELRISLVESGSYPPSRPSADLLLTSLALALGDRSIAVVLTGGGTDGATGATAVHKHGGVVLATDEATSTAFSMPSATIERDNIRPTVISVSAVAGALERLVLQPLP